MQGWTALKKEFESVFRTITQLGYAVCFIAHDKEEAFKRQDGSEYTMIKPSVGKTYNSIIENMADIYAYMHPVLENGENKVKFTLRSLDGTIRCGGRFKYIAPEIDGNYQSLVKALNDAIDKEAETKGQQFVTNERNEVPVATEINFDETMKRCENAIAYITENATEEQMQKDYAPRISQIVGMYLGKGKKLSQCTRDQGEMISLIADDLEKLVEEFKEKIA